MEALNKFLENLKPGGASNLPKSKFEQTLTDDSEVDSPEPQEQTIKTDVNKPIGEPNTKKEMPQKPRKGLVKQMADVRQESLENEEICNNKLMKTEEIKQVPPNPLPRKKKIPKINEPENESVEKLWQDLNVGKNGFLTISELEKVCNYLGMNTPDQKSLKSLFAIIDTDSDGRVSLAEFSAGLKKYGNVQNLEISNLNLSSSSISGLFSCIDPNKQGFCEAQRVVELWASGGILNGNEVLDYLEFSMNKPVNLIVLSKALEQEIINENLDAITLTGIITYQKELYYCRNRQVEDSRASLMGHQQTANSSLLQKSGELQNNLDKLTEELSYITYENESLKEHVKELEEINRHQIEELDAVADLHRKMDLELKLYRDNKNQNSQAFQNDKETERSLFLSNNTIKNLEKDLSLRIHECEILTKTMESQKQIIENQSKSIEMLSTETADEKKVKVEKEIIKINSYNNELRDIELAKSLQSENSNLKQKLKSLNTKIEIAINREQQYQVKLQEMEDIANDFKGTEEKLNMSLKELSKENNDKEKKLKNFSEKIKDLEKENTFLLSSIQSFDEERQKETRNFLFEQENLRKSCQSLENQLYKYKQVQDQLDSSLGEIRSKTSIISKLEEANDRLAISVRNALSKLELLSRSDVEMNPKQLIKENLQIQRENILLEDQINQLKKKVEFTDSSQQIQGLNKQIRSSQSEINKKNIKIEELEERLRKLQRESPNSSSSQKKSFRKYDHLQFKYDELEKKYETQMDQVEKTDSLLKELFETNTNLLKSLQRMEESKDKSDLTIIQLEDKVQNLQNLLKNK